MKVLLFYYGFSWGDESVRICLKNHLLRRCDFCLSKRATSFLYYNESVQAVTKTRKDVALWPIV